MLSTAVSNDSLFGSNYADDMFGGLGNDLLRSYGGNDRLFGEAGDDTLSGYYGNDTLDGGAGNDTINGGYDADVLNGGDGADTLRGDGTFEAAYDGADTLNGGNGTDTLIGGGGDDTLFGDDDNDTLRGGTGADTLTGGAGADTFVIEDVPYGITSSGYDIISDFSAVQGDKIDVSLLGISEFSTVQQLLTDLGASSTLSFLRGGYSQTTSITGLADPTTLTAADFVLSTVVSHDNLTGSNYADDMFGGLGNDFLQSFGGNDRLFGEAGDDTLSGYYGNDTLIGGAGNDTINGGYDTDVLNGGDGNDTLRGDYSSNSTTGGNDTLDGGIGTDTLFGGSGDDTLYGGNDNDTLRGGYGADTLTGGAGSDTFVIDDVPSGTTTSSSDIVSDFSAAQVDKIDVSLLGISEFSTVQQLLADLGASSTLSFLRGGYSQTTSITGLADPTTLTAADFVLSTVVSHDNLNGSNYADDMFGGLGNDLSAKLRRQRPPVRRGG